MKILVVNSDFSDIFEYSRFFLHKNFSSKHTFEFWVKSNRNAIKTYSLKKIINKIIFLLKKGDFLKFAGFRLSLIFSKDIHKFEKSKWRKINKFFKPLIKKNIEAKYFEPIIDGMLKVTVGEDGTAQNSQIANLDICGKTGTAQNPHGEDHSIFIAFAPKDNPKIAISVYVENGGWGSTWAAPIASLMIDKYINKNISNSYQEKFILDGNLIAED